MKIHQPVISIIRDEVEYRVNVESMAGQHTLWFRIPRDHGHLLTSSPDASMVALLIPAMSSGENLNVSGTVSARLLYNLAGPTQWLLRQIIPQLHPIQIIPEGTYSDGRPAEGVITGFSGGIDSYFTILKHHLSEVPKPFKLTHLLINNVGGHGSGGEVLFNQHYELLLPVAKKLDLPFIKVNSNLDSFYNEYLNFEQTHTLRNAAVALLFQEGIGHFLYSSATSYRNFYVRETRFIGYTDPVLLPHLSTERLEAMTVGNEYTRVEKTRQVAELPISYDTINVCLHSTDGRNCSRCEKCLRTMLTMEILGVIDRYAGSFDLEAYQPRKNKFIDRILGSPISLYKEIVQYAEETHYQFPFWVSLNARLHRPGKQLIRLVRFPFHGMKLLLKKKQ